MLEIRGKFYNAKEIRCLNRNNRDNLVITFIDGKVEQTDEYYNDYSFRELVNKWEGKLV